MNGAAKHFSCKESVVPVGKLIFFYLNQSVSEDLTVKTLMITLKGRRSWLRDLTLIIDD